MKSPPVIIFISLYLLIATAIITNLLFVKKAENKIISPKYNTISADTVYMAIDSLDSKRDTIKFYYETKVSNYHILPSSERISLFAERINR